MKKEEVSMVTEYPKMLYHPLKPSVIVRSAGEEEEYVERGYGTSIDTVVSVAHVSAEIKETEERLVELMKKYRKLTGKDFYGEEDLKSIEEKKEQADEVVAFKCGVCRKSFSTKGALTIHMRSVHKS